MITGWHGALGPAQAPPHLRRFAVRNPRELAPATPRHAFSRAAPCTARPWPLRNQLVVHSCDRASPCRPIISPSHQETASPQASEAATGSRSTRTAPSHSILCKVTLAMFHTALAVLTASQRGRTASGAKLPKIKGHVGAPSTDIKAAIAAVIPDEQVGGGWPGPRAVRCSRNTVKMTCSASSAPPALGCRRAYGRRSSCAAPCCAPRRRGGPCCPPRAAAAPLPRPREGRVRARSRKTESPQHRRPGPAPEPPARRPPNPQARLRAIKTVHGSKSLGDVTVEQALGGMRAIPVRRLQLMQPHQANRRPACLHSGQPRMRHHCTPCTRRHAAALTEYAAHCLKLPQTASRHPPSHLPRACCGR